MEKAGGWAANYSAQRAMRARGHAALLDGGGGVHAVLHPAYGPGED